MELFCEVYFTLVLQLFVKYLGVIQFRKSSVKGKPLGNLPEKESFRLLCLRVSTQVSQLLFRGALGYWRSGYSIILWLYILRYFTLASSDLTFHWPNSPSLLGFFVNMLDSLMNGARTNNKIMEFRITRFYMIWALNKCVAPLSLYLRSFRF